MRTARQVSLAIAFLVTLPAFAAAADAPPQTGSAGLFPPAVQVGKGQTVRAVGVRDLDEPAALQFSAIGVSASPHDQPLRRPNEAREFTITASADAAPGPGFATLSGLYGTGAPASFHVEPGPFSVEHEPNDQPTAAQPLPLNQPVYGFVGHATDVDVYTFAGRKGQVVAIRCEGSRYPSELRPMLELSGPSGFVGETGAAYQRDATLLAELPADGNYSLAVSDFAYRGGEAFLYRLAVSDRPAVRLVWPPALRLDRECEVTLLGVNLPDGVPVEGHAPLVAVKRIVVPRTASAGLTRTASAGLNSHDDDLMGDGGPLGEGTVRLDAATCESLLGFPLIEPNGAPLLLEPGEDSVTVADDHGSVRDVTVPADVFARVDDPHDRDEYRFTARRGDVLMLRAARWDGRSGPVLELRVEQIAAPTRPTARLSFD